MTVAADFDKRYLDVPGAPDGGESTADHGRVAPPGSRTFVARLD